RSFASASCQRRALAGYERNGYRDGLPGSENAGRNGHGFPEIRPAASSDVHFSRFGKQGTALLCQGLAPARQHCHAPELPERAVDPKLGSRCEADLSKRKPRRAPGGPATVRAFQEHLCRNPTQPVTISPAFSTSRSRPSIPLKVRSSRASSPPSKKTWRSSTSA